LASHLARCYGVALGARQCRRLLRRLLPDPERHKSDVASVGLARRDLPSRVADRSSTPPPNSDPRNKERALRQLKRLALAGLPVEPFIMTMFDIIGAGIAVAQNQVFLPSDGTRPSAFITSSADVGAYAEAYERFFVNGSTEMSGLKYRFDKSGFDKMSSRTVWRLEEYMLPHFYRSEGYNEVLRPIGFHRNVSLTCAEGTEVMGFYPVWRCPDIKPFAYDDILFLEACAPLIAHGLKTACLLERIDRFGDSQGFLPSARWRTGVVLIDTSGRPVSIDDAARAIFMQLAAFEPVSDDPVLPQRLRESLEHIAKVLKGIRDNSNGITPPIVRIDAYASGFTIKLRATLSRRIEGTDHLIAVLVERGELRGERERRLIHRWGLNQSELTILRSLGRGARLNEVAAELAVRNGTLKVYMRRLANKVDASRTPALREFAAGNFN
jgi:DNA-binding CsgD family transcriptional regulator